MRIIDSRITRIMWFIGDIGLGLIDSHKDVVSWKILVFSNILDFQGVNWAQNWTKTIVFGYVLLPLKHLILKDCSETVFVLWETTSGQKFEGEKAQKPPKWGHFMDFALPQKHLKIYHKNIWKFITWQPQMLH